ncbi:TPA: hypothetical protein ACR599_005829, partial [Klebsiella variicola]
VNRYPILQISFTLQNPPQAYCHKASSHFLKSTLSLKYQDEVKPARSGPKSTPKTTPLEDSSSSGP